MFQSVKASGIRILALLVCVVVLAGLQWLGYDIVKEFYILAFVFTALSILIGVITLNLDSLDTSFRPVVLLGMEVVRMILSLGVIALILFLNPPSQKIVFVAALMCMYVFFLFIDIAAVAKQLNSLSNTTNTPSINSIVK